MSTETATIAIAKPPAEVWDLVGQFGGLDTWMAGVDACTVDGDLRTIETMGLTITERLVNLDDAGRAITYSIVGDDAPVSSHEATITVHAADEGSTVTWDVTVEPPEMGEMFKGIYQGALDQLKATLEG